MHVLLDNNVPDSVAAVFERHGHSVVRLREVLLTDSPDPVVAAASEEMGAVLVSADSDFRKQIAPRIPKGSKARFRKLSRIALRCNPPQSAQRIAKAMSLIEAELEIAQNSPDKRMLIAIGNSYIRTER